MLICHWSVKIFADKCEKKLSGCLSFSFADKYGPHETNLFLRWSYLCCHNPLQGKVACAFVSIFWIEWTRRKHTSCQGHIDHNSSLQLLGTPSPLFFRHFHRIDSPRLQVAGCRGFQRLEGTVKGKLNLMVAKLNVLILIV